MKTELTKRTSASEQRRLQELLSAEELGDRMPSQVLQCIQQLLGNMATTMDATLLRELFLQRLPFIVRMVLTPSAEALNLDQLAQLANRIVQTSLTPTIAATTDTTSQLAAQVADLTKRLDQLTSQMSKTISSLFRLLCSCRPTPRQRRKSTSEDSDDGLCRYHRKFGGQCKEMYTSVPEGGKLLGQTLSATSVTGHSPSRLLFLTDKYSGRRFLVDTGTKVSVIPPSPADRRIKPDCSGLSAVNGSMIATFGTRSLTLDLGLRRVFR